MSRCSDCNKTTRGLNTVDCMGDCGAIIHAECATNRLGYDPDGANSLDSVYCEPCVMQRSTTIPRSPIKSHTSIDPPTHKEVVEQNIAELRADVSVFSSSYETLNNRIGTLELNSEATKVDIQTIREENSALKSQVNLLSNRLTNNDSNNTSAEITISGLPIDITDTPNTIVDRILKALGIPGLTSDVLEIRQIPSKQPLADGERPHTSTTTQASLGTLIVSLKSSRVRDFIIQKRREKKELSINEVFALNRKGNIFINEFLPSATYNLLRRTKSKAEELGYKFVWLKAGNIYVRRSEKTEIIQINAESDLDSLT
ncbi:uncharacterized protein LOC107217996 [Neodiprion lecontei]|uniref:Uncharacterized protein LOC107217996 n=1 Tax=Neodiprion lecontei TaxID=441921 RepID=A0A6J0B899_NEOLC|nr:uncharacterized protein LOC107217996 [Neodiprion lecontei]